MAESVRTYEKIDYQRENEDDSSGHSYQWTNEFII